ncbi:MAG: arsenite methyltransferase [Bacillota bacterium]
MERTVDGEKPDSNDLKNEEKLRKAVREGYARIAAGSGSCCCGPARVQDISLKVGYTAGELEVIPEGANLGLGCGNPIALASLKEGETVLDLGSGPGLDCFLAAAKVGPGGKVIGVDMTPEMVEKARANARQGTYNHVEFRLGEIENLPVADNSVDVIISNCVINLSPDKKRVFEEAFRVLKPGGRVMVSDITLLKELPDFIKNSAAAYVGCLSGAIMRDQYLAAMESAGFSDVKILDETSFPIDCIANDPTAQAVADNLNIAGDQLKDIIDGVVSIKVAAVKPRQD